MAGPQVEKKPDGHEPEVVRAHTHLHRAVIEKPGKDLRVRYPTDPFFWAAAPGTAFLALHVPLGATEHGLPGAPVRRQLQRRGEQALRCVLEYHKNID